jgi:hypothetical protein
LLGQYLAARYFGRDVDVVAHFMLADLLKTVASDRGLLSLLGYRSRTEWDAETGALDGLRNSVAHGVRDLIDPERGPAELAELDRRIQRLANGVESAVASLGPSFTA